MSDDSRLAALERAARLSPGDPVAWERLAEAYAAVGSPDLSTVALTQAVRLQPDNVGRRFQLAEWLSRARRWSEALVQFQEALRRDPGAAVHWRAVGAVLFNLQRYDAAAEHLQEALRREPTMAGTWAPLGWALYRAGRPAEAAVALEEGARREPQGYWLWLGLGAAYDAVGRAEDAAAAHDVAIRVDPTGVAALVELGRLRLKQSRPAEALTFLERAARLRPDNPEVWAGLTDAHFELGNLPAALEAAAARARVDTDQEGALRSLVDLQCRADLHLETFRTALRLMTTYPRTRRDGTLVSIFGIALTGLKKHRVAVRAHRFALRIDNGLAGSWHNVGFICAQRRKWTPAAAFFAKAAAAKGDWPRAWRDLGRALRRCGRHAEARDACRKAVDLDQRNTDSWRALGEVLAVVEDGCGLREVLDRLQSLDPAQAVAFRKEHGLDQANSRA